jgi:hypothetical protein
MHAPDARLSSAAIRRDPTEFLHQPWTPLRLAAYLALYTYAVSFVTVSVWLPVLLAVAHYYEPGLAVALGASTQLGIGSGVVCLHFPLIKRVLGLPDIQ